jgi:hypothetical protein
MSGSIPPLPNTPSWRDAQLKEKSTGTTLQQHSNIWEEILSPVT